MKSMLVGLLSGGATHWWQTSSLVPERVRPPHYGEGVGLDAWAWDVLKAVQESTQSGEFFLAVIVGLLVMLVWPLVEWVVRRAAAAVLRRRQIRAG